MSTRRCDFERSLHMLLTADVAHVGAVRDRLGMGPVWRHRLEYVRATEMLYQLYKGRDADDIEIMDQRRFCRVDLRHVHLAQPMLPRGHYHRQDALRMAQRSLEAQLAEEEPVAGCGRI